MGHRPTSRRLLGKENPRSLLPNCTIVCLLFLVAGFATMAKNGQYYPQSHPANHIAISAKFLSSHPHADVAGNDAQNVNLFFLWPLCSPDRLPDAEDFPKGQIGVKLSSRDRSPPFFLNN